MFMPGMFAGAGLNNADPEAERDPPRIPTPVTFPIRSAYSQTEWSNVSPPPKLQSFFSKVVRPSDISAAHVEALNIHLLPPCPPDELIPLAVDGSSYLPPLSPNQAINAASYAEVTKVNACSAKKQADLVERLTELKLSNDAGFRTITRTTKHGTKPPKLSWLRKFWEGLESVSQYWDTSLDCYYETESVTTEPEKGAKRLRMDSVQGETLVRNKNGPPHEIASSDDEAGPGIESTNDSHASERANENCTQPNGFSPGQANGGESSSTSTDSRKCWRYRGRRTASGRDMPDQFRSDTVRAFVEAAAWPFNCSVAPPRHMPIVQMNRLNIPVRQTAAVYRNPKERSRVRAGFLEGPVLTIQCRPDTDFDAPSLTIEQMKTRARLDLMRELGALLQLAQERRRHGKAEHRSGEGKWWTSKPRWGGGRDGELLSDGGNANVPEVPPNTDAMLGAPKPRSPRKKKTPAMLWKELRCGSKMWDPRIAYEAIGKDADSAWDEVFMVSSLNHHISILKLRVHGAYVEYLQSETLPDPLPTDKDWCSPKLQRSQWFDLLDVGQRVEAFRALWGVIAYLMREMDSLTKAGAEDDAGKSD
ncbi:uncharacterized protein RCC_00037 [Ramularia collo-cygni]|uniref:Uncharacterized protein n=1 Tax=Ramularia collo-cygni TaxID=112498 RepID=A0A2D3UL83_9PEZI|nr:uncharacterized protein RCC_00037 [Ramularia collo-cygni]CZT14062.1 uncharacterized protein RCC_00037 [Ramularia collo-cygni]